ncbi:hypothetical protein M9H77_35204 [Catharanthus roseus]|uniref:Uncharacterized protein n=1 Tax=Catharanthus roseus TaxID=4058 RepID=A0ACB9ZQ36_CATRO|nr:hypothetical protein M9H77_35204 [Catharanthus roseus]
MFIIIISMPNVHTKQKNHHRHPHESPEQKFRQCQEKCQSTKEVEQRKTCQQQCKQEYGKESEQEGKGAENLLGKKKEEEEKKKKQREKNPYFFEEQRFESRFRTEEGHFRVLQRFSDKSELLEGIDNYRLAKLEANPNTFMIPHHCDSEAVFVVTNGQGTITFVHQQHTESFNLQKGDAIKVPTGSTVYLINRDNNEKLRIFMLVHPINTPGHFEEFFSAGGREPQSFYNVFSNELLEAALNTPQERFKRVFGKLRKGFIIKASQEQIRALSQEQQQEAGSGEGPYSQPGQGQEQGREGESNRGPFNVLQQQPLFSNEYGQFFEATPDTNEQLKHLDFSVAFMNIHKGSMIVPYYNTRSTKLVVVVGGDGHFEMACPHIASQGQESEDKKEKEKKHESKEKKEKESKEKERESTSVEYQRISARFSVGDVFIIPAGHPISIVSSGNDDLQLLGIGVNALHNHKNFLAGKDNIWKQVKQEAKGLSFESEATEVDQIFGSQGNAYFVPGPNKKQSQRKGEEEEEQEQEKGHSLASILDSLGFI